MDRERSLLAANLEKAQVIVSIPSWLDARSTGILLESYLNFGFKAFVLPFRMVEKNQEMLRGTLGKRAGEKVAIGVTGVKGVRDVEVAINQNASFIVSDDKCVLKSTQSHPILGFYSATTPKEIREGLQLGADFIGFSPVGKEPLEPKALKLILDEFGTSKLLPGNVSNPPLLARYFQESGVKMAITDFTGQRRTEIEKMKLFAMHLQCILDPRSKYMSG